MLALGISPSPAAAAAAPGTPASSLLAGPGGSASTTASASSCSGACAEPTVSRQPSGVRASPRTIALVRTAAPDAAATAGTSVPRPLASVVKTGLGALPADALPADALPAGALPAGALPAGALPAGVLPAGVPAPSAAASSTEAAAAVSEAYRPDAAASAGNVASNDSCSDRPA